MTKSTLFLVGAGPGDPELITLKAINVLRSADVILCDALANESLLQYGKRAKHKLVVGKKFGCHTLSQEEINGLIIYYAGRFNTIVRLKGGDPFIFGRAQEEIDAALSAGLMVEVIPGISSALAVPASQMIPLTCRGINESFWVITGTNRNGGLSPDISLAARSSATIVILMAMSKLESICRIFMEKGKAETPAAIIQNGTTADMRMVIGKVRDISFRSAEAALTNPAVIVIGEVVGLYRKNLPERIARTLSPHFMEQ